MAAVTDRKGKGKSSAADVAAPTERSPLLGRSSSSLAVRHGRGLLSDDEDDSAATISIRSSSRRAKGHRSSKSNVTTTTTQHNEYDADDDRGAYNRDNDDDADSLDDLLGPEEANRRRQLRLRNRGRYNTQAVLCYTSLIVLTVIFLIFAIIHIWLGRFVSEQFSQDGKLLRERAEHALIMEGPDRVQMYNISGEQITVQIDMRMGIDVRAVFGWNGTEASAKRIGTIRRWERHLVGWMSRRIGQTSVDLPQPVLLSPADKPSSHMAQFGLAAPIVLPLYFPQTKNYSANDTHWLRPVRLTVPVEVLESSTLASFVNHTMNNRSGRVHVTVQQANIGLGKQEDRTWLTRQVRRYSATSVSDIQKDVDFQVPDSPDVPSDPSALVQLKSYQLIAIPDVGIPPIANNSAVSESLGIYATARVINPAFDQLKKLGLDLNIPFTWPYKIYLPVKRSKKQNKHNSTRGNDDRVLLARGVVEPFDIPSASKHFEVSINGTVEKVQNTSDPLSQALSRFVTRFLSGKNNTVVVAFDHDSPFAAHLPQFLIPLISPLSVENTIPGLPADERELLKDLQIQDMKVHGAEDGSGGFQIDGLMEGQVVFPDGLDKLDNGINITAVWPDILLYDNLPPADDSGQMPPQPLPLNAFARFRTTGYTPAETVKLADNTTVMRAHVKNVPFEILRQNVLQRWLAKIVFSGGKGVRTGIKGFSQAQATLRGFGEIELHRLPVLGVFYAQNPYAKSLVEQLP